MNPSTKAALADFATLAQTLERLNVVRTVDEAGALLIGHPAFAAVRDWIAAAELRQGERVQRIVQIHDEPLYQLRGGCRKIEAVTVRHDAPAIAGKLNGRDWEMVDRARRYLQALEAAAEARFRDTSRG